MTDRDRLDAILAIKQATRDWTTGVYRYYGPASGAYRKAMAMLKTIEPADCRGK